MTKIIICLGFAIVAIVSGVGVIDSPEEAMKMTTALIAAGVCGVFLGLE